MMMTTMYFEECLGISSVPAIDFPKCPEGFLNGSPMSLMMVLMMKMYLEDCRGMTHIQTCRQAERQTGRHAEGQRHRQTDRQTHIHTHQ